MIYKNFPVIKKIALAFGLAGLILLSACAKKQVTVNRVTKTKTGQVLSVLKASPTSKTKGKKSTSIDNMKKDNGDNKFAGAPADNKGYFDFDSSVVRSDTAEVLKSFGEWLLDNPEDRLVIEGHADERGTREYNLALGARRANAAKRFLVSMGVSPLRITTISYGKERPDDPSSNETAWAKNRRFVALKLQ
ncbi:MAG: peptidoglycan-associated lipoprotein Pal [Alphaproteobacteria bacterium]